MRIRDWSSDVCSSDLSTAAMPRMKPKSPTRLTRNALGLAKIAVGRLNQRPISRYETRPTASQPKNSCRTLLLMTNMSIEQVNSEKVGRASGRENVWKCVEVTAVAGE